MNLDEYQALQQKKRKPQSHEETYIQISVVSHVRTKYPGLPIIMCPIFKFSGTPSQRAIQGQRMKRMGYTNGTPDLFFPIRKKGFPGLFIELKTKKGTKSKEQEIMINKLSDSGYCVHIANTYEQAKEIIDEYMQ